MSLPEEGDKRSEKEIFNEEEGGNTESNRNISSTAAETQEDNRSKQERVKEKAGYGKRKTVKEEGGYFSARDLISDIHQLVSEGQTCEAHDIENPEVQETHTDDENETPDGQQIVSIRKVGGSGSYGVSGVTLGKNAPPDLKGKGGKRAYITRPRKKQPSYITEHKENVQISPRKNQQPNKEENELNIVKQIEEIKTSPRAKSAGFLGRKSLQRPNTTPRVLKPQTLTHQELDIAMLKVQGQNQDPIQPGRRTVGRGPPRAQSATPLGMLRKQQEMLRRAPSSPYRTAPSIPGPHSLFGGRSPRIGQAFSAELEAHAKKDNSPRHYMQRGI